MKIMKEMSTIGVLLLIVLFLITFCIINFCLWALMFGVLPQ